nr:anillin-like [Penaeus vannamei]
MSPRTGSRRFDTACEYSFGLGIHIMLPGEWLPSLQVTHPVRAASLRKPIISILFHVIAVKHLNQRMAPYVLSATKESLMIVPQLPFLEMGMEGILAITVVLQRVEQQGTPQHVEAEKLLLLASQKRQTALNEIQRLKTEGALAQRSWPGDEDCCQGSISISRISVPLKQDFIKKGISGDTIYHLMVLVKHRDQVISSQLLTTPECVVDGAVTFPNLMSLHHLTSDFNIALEVYALSTIHHRNLSIKKVSTFSVWNEKCILVLP